MVRNNVGFKCYLVDNRLQTAYFEAEFGSDSSFYSASYNENVITALESYESTNGKELVIRGGQMFSLKEVSLHLLLNINEDFDDDLLKAVTTNRWPRLHDRAPNAAVGPDGVGHLLQIGIGPCGLR